MSRRWWHEHTNTCNLSHPPTHARTCQTNVSMHTGPHSHRACTQSSSPRHMRFSPPICLHMHTIFHIHPHPLPLPLYHMRKHILLHSLLHAHKYCTNASMFQNTGNFPHSYAHTAIFRIPVHTYCTNVSVQIFRLPVHEIWLHLTSRHVLPKSQGREQVIW